MGLGLICNRINLKGNYKIINMLHYQILVSSIRGKIYKKDHIKNKIKIAEPTYNGEYELPDRSYSLSDFQDDFEYINNNF